MYHRRTNSIHHEGIISFLSATSVQIMSTGKVQASLKDEERVIKLCLVYLLFYYANFKLNIRSIASVSYDH